MRKYSQLFFFNCSVFLHVCVWRYLTSSPWFLCTPTGTAHLLWSSISPANLLFNPFILTQSILPFFLLFKKHFFLPNKKGSGMPCKSWNVSTPGTWPKKCKKSGTNILSKVSFHLFAWNCARPSFPLSLVQKTPIVSSLDLLPCLSCRQPSPPYRGTNDSIKAEIR